MSKYLDRSIHTLACHWVLVTSEKAMHAQMRKMKVPRADWPVFPGTDKSTTHAMVSYLEQSGGAKMAVVQVSEKVAGDGILIAQVLCHESVHVWQWHCELIGGTHGMSKEFEAYGIQHIFETLMREYARQVAFVSNRSPRKARK
jgi:hypothetical protein